MEGISDQQLAGELVEEGTALGGWATLGAAGDVVMRKEPVDGGAGQLLRPAQG